MAEDPQNPAPDGTDGAPADAESAPSRRGLGRFASRFRRGADASSRDAATDTGTNDEAVVPLDPDADVPVLLNRPDVDWSAARSERLSPGEPSDPPQPREPDRAPIGPEAVTTDDAARTEPDGPAMSPTVPPVVAPVESPAVAASHTPPTAPDAPALGDLPSPALAPREFDEATEPLLPEPADGPRTRPAGISAHLAVLTGVATVVIVAFLLVEPSPRWLLLLGAAAVVFGLDGTLRQTWRAPFALGQETAPFLFAPALYMLAVPVLIEHNVSGELALLVGIGAGLGFGGLAWAEVASVRPQAAEYEQARIVVTANTYLAGFAIFSLSYVFEIGLPAAIIATSIAASMLAVEILREGEIDPMETLGLSLVAGVVIGEFRWLLYYVPLDTYLAGLTLLLVFYLATGLLHSHVVRALNRIIALEYGGIAAAGLALVVLARAAGLA